MKKPVSYTVWIAEQLDEQWADWFAPLVIQQAVNGTTRLSGPVRDQGELHGILAKVRDLNLTLLAVQQVEHSDELGTNPQSVDEKA
jgi:hypothetical protein